jgi:hypothetical protein
MTEKEKSIMYPPPPRTPSLIKVALTLASTLIITFTLVAASCGKGREAESNGTETGKSSEKEKDKSSGKGGTFTLTGIPSEYNGKYAMCSADALIMGYQSVEPFKLSKISKGSVSVIIYVVWQKDKSLRESCNSLCSKELAA